MQLRLALPKGRLQNPTADLLEKAGFRLVDYHERSRAYRLKSNKFQNLFVKVFQEKDIAIQVAIGNYDLGICGLDWIEELLTKYPSDAVVKVRELGYGKGNLYAAVGRFSGLTSIQELKERSGQGGVRIVSEYPNLAEALALRLRLRKFKIFPVWGAAEVYPPENADLVIIAETSAEALLERDLLSLTTIGTTNAFLIGNRNTLEQRDISELLESLCHEEAAADSDKQSPLRRIGVATSPPRRTADSICFALPDGHQQSPTSEFLSKTSLKIQGYDQALSTRQPSINLDGVIIKVVRPQDMPLQVANKNFDLAISGRDWLLDHLSRFPSSPVTELLDLGFGKVRIVAVVSKSLPANSVEELREMIKARQFSTLRIASEYVNIADKYARDNHLAPYKVIPTWGATEAFIPEDADLLIENTQTGSTLAKHGLKIIDTLFQSSACLIGSSLPPGHPLREERISYIIGEIRKASSSGD